jgi:hypothetical protein
MKATTRSNCFSQLAFGGVQVNLDTVDAATADKLREQPRMDLAG